MTTYGKPKQAIRAYRLEDLLQKIVEAIPPGHWTPDEVIIRVCQGFITRIEEVLHESHKGENSRFFAHALCVNVARGQWYSGGEYASQETRDWYRGTRDGRRADKVIHRLRNAGK